MRLSDFLIIGCGVLLNAMAQLGLKTATLATGPLQLSSQGWRRVFEVFAVAPFWWALAAYGASVLIWVFGLSRVPVGQAYPLLSLGYVINIGFAWWLLGEVPNAQRVAGVLVIVVGVVLVARS